MSKVDALLRNYEQHVALPWERSLAGPQRVWCVVYDKADERRLRARVGDFEVATRQAGHGWSLCDISDAFPRWLAEHDYREQYFRRPEHLELQLPDFHEHLAATVRGALEDPATDDRTVVALLGVGSLFGFGHVSGLIRAVAPYTRGRLLVFFPGEYENNTYRLLDARDGWNYTAVPITAHSGPALR